MTLEDSSDSDVSLQGVFSTSSLQHLTQMRCIYLCSLTEFGISGHLRPFRFKVTVSYFCMHLFEWQQHRLA